MLARARDGANAHLRQIDAHTSAMVTGSVRACWFRFVDGVSGRAERHYTDTQGDREPNHTRNASKAEE
jgi:hypothetical protein